MARSEKDFDREIERRLGGRAKRSYRGYAKRARAFDKTVRGIVEGGARFVSGIDPRVGAVQAKVRRNPSTAVVHNAVRKAIGVIEVLRTHEWDKARSDAQREIARVARVAIESELRRPCWITGGPHPSDADVAQLAGLVKAGQGVDKTLTKGRRKNTSSGRTLPPRNVSDAYVYARHIADEALYLSKTRPESKAAHEMLEAARAAFAKALKLARTAKVKLAVDDIRRDLKLATSRIGHPSNRTGWPSRMKRNGGQAVDAQKAYDAAAKHAAKCRSCGRRIVDEAGNPGLFSEACPEGLKLLVRYMDAIGEYVPPFARKTPRRNTATKNGEVEHYVTQRGDPIEVRVTKGDHGNWTWKLRGERNALARLRRAYGLPPVMAFRGVHEIWLHAEDWADMTGRYYGYPLRRANKAKGVRRAPQHQR